MFLLHPTLIIEEFLHCLIFSTPQTEWNQMAGKRNRKECVWHSFCSQEEVRQLWLWRQPVFLLHRISTELIQDRLVDLRSFSSPHPDFPHKPEQWWRDALGLELSVSLIGTLGHHPAFSFMLKLGVLGKRRSLQVFKILSITVAFRVTFSSPAGIQQWKENWVWRYGLRACVTEQVPALASSYVTFDLPNQGYFCHLVSVCQVDFLNMALPCHSLLYFLTSMLYFLSLWQLSGYFGCRI